MPPYIQGALRTYDWSQLGSDKKFSYDYPDRLRLEPDSPLHKLVVKEVLDRANDAKGALSDRYTAWKEIDRTMIAYKQPTKDDIKAREKGRPAMIVLPLSFAIRQTLLTYNTSTFLNQPYFRYNGIEGMDHIKAALMELLVDLHCYQSKVALSLYSAWQDSYSYGIGIGMPHWMKKFGRGTARNPMGGPTLMWEGNALGHISPYDALLDPNSSVNAFQSSEFFGYLEHTNITSLLAREQSQPERWFNCRYLSYLQRKSIFEPDSEDYSGKRGLETSSLRPVDVVQMIINLIPREWKTEDSKGSMALGNGEYPEKWLFAVAGDGLVLRAEPLGLFYDEYPAAVMAPFFDNYSISPISLIERIGGIQEFADWLINSYLVNVRKAMGINIVYDPLAINGNDLRSDEIVKLIRMNPSHWGRGDVGKYVQQLKIDNVTAENVPAVGFIFDIAQRVTGVSDILQGIMRTGGERRSATEAQQVFSSSISRVQTSAKLTSIQFHQDIARMFAYNIQQLMSQERVLTISGDRIAQLADEYGVDPAVIATPTKVTAEDFLDFDFNMKSHDAALPGEENVDGWLQLLQPMLTNPQIGQQLGLDMR